MILALDVGNTHIVMGCMEDTRILCSVRLKTDATKTEQEYAVLIRQLLDFNGMDCSFEGCIISSVVPQVNHALTAALKMITGKKPLVVGAGIKTGLNILLDSPASLGSDLAAGAVAALDLYKPPIIVLDMGTATKFSVLDDKGNFLGGVLTPGVAASLNTLATSTAQLPFVTLEAPKRCIGSNTVSAMQSGAIFGAAAMVEGMIDRIEAELGYKCTVVATGGNSQFVIPHCRHEIIYSKDLLLHGLAVLYRKNRKA